MTYRAHIERAFTLDGIAVYFGQKLGGGAYEVWRPTQIEREVIEGNTVGVSHQPTLILPDDLGRALSDALVGYYGGTSAGQTLRSDYEHERSRTDELIKTVSTMAVGLINKSRYE